MWVRIIYTKRADAQFRSLTPLWKCILNKVSNLILLNKESHESHEHKTVNIFTVMFAKIFIWLRLLFCICCCECKLLTWMNAVLVAGLSNSNTLGKVLRGSSIHDHNQLVLWRIHEPLFKTVKDNLMSCFQWIISLKTFTTGL